MSSPVQSSSSPSDYPRSLSLSTHQELYVVVETVCEQTVVNSSPFSSVLGVFVDHDQAMTLSNQLQTKAIKLAGFKEGEEDLYFDSSIKLKKIYSVCISNLVLPIPYSTEAGAGAGKVA